jgi:hypothetical protein
VNESKDNYEEIIESVIAKSVRSENISYNNYNEVNYYDEHNNSLLQKVVYNNSLGIRYDVNEYQYDKYGNIITESRTLIIDQKIIEYDCKTFYEYEYDDCNRIVQKKTYYKKDIASEMIKYYYEQNNLVKTEYYKMQAIDAPDYIEISRFDFSTPYKIHYYSYSDGKLKEEKVCLHSNDISYYKVYIDNKSSGKYINPFKTEYSWTIDSISFNTYEISIKEKTLYDDMLLSIVDTILKHYSDCVMILFNLQYLENQNFDQNIINSVIERYKDITINFI